MVRVAYVVIILGSLVGACRSPFDEAAFHVQIRTLQATYRPLDNAVAQITNHSDAPIFRDLCSGQIEGRRTPDDPWNGSHGSGRACIVLPGTPPRQPQRIGPGETVLDALPINANAYAGEWRFQYFLYSPDGHLLSLSDRISNLFRVVRDSV
jgi:hypothetical protein